MPHRIHIRKSPLEISVVRIHLRRSNPTRFDPVVECALRDAEHTGNAAACDVICPLGRPRHQTDRNFNSRQKQVQSVKFRYRVVFSMRMADPRSKILTHEQVDDWVSRLRSEGRRIGFTCGSFDLMHPGHAHYLYLARQRCDQLLVAVNSDASVRRYKSPLRPINPEADRMYVIASLEAVDAVTVLQDDRPLSLL